MLDRLAAALRSNPSDIRPRLGEHWAPNLVKTITVPLLGLRSAAWRRDSDGGCGHDRCTCVRCRHHSGSSTTRAHCDCEGCGSDSSSSGLRCCTPFSVIRRTSTTSQSPVSDTYAMQSDRSRARTRETGRVAVDLSGHLTAPATGRGRALSTIQIRTRAPGSDDGQSGRNTRSGAGTCGGGNPAGGCARVRTAVYPPIG